MTNPTQPLQLGDLPRRGRGCAFCRDETPDCLQIGDFSLTWNSQGDATISSINLEGVILPETSEVKKILRAMTGGKEESKPLKEGVVTVHNAFDHCPVCNAELGPNFDHIQLVPQEELREILGMKDSSINLATVIANMGTEIAEEISPDESNNPGAQAGTQPATVAAGNEY